MKRQVKKWILGSAVFALLFAGLLLVIILNPVLTYANKTTYQGFTIYHNEPVDPQLPAVLDQAKALLKKSEFYKADLDLNICVNDGSSYPNFVKVILGPAFAWAIDNKLILQGEMNCAENFIELNGYKWNLTELLAHEMTHCLQYANLGFWKSNPVAGIPDWKWEGYAEYIARQGPQHDDLLKNLDRLEKDHNKCWEITLEDHTIAPRELYQYQLMVRYCLEIKQLTYSQLLSNPIDEGAIKIEMNDWYVHKKRTNNHQTYTD
ncbi:hypothetical protein [Sphingobacterium deserti]|uniref:Uncharacterized protein n=1 Tax=Sphingobacterium deserti TaxID=1229276 RepID=A0A0B8T5F6_9SPHI|nr:hypothetical protein [Sphingobacterium deserti]KGE12834.1 hypothetical protein DI53_3388 [Sphingobacterium deserti]